MKRLLTNLVAGILLTIATAGPASAICLDSTVKIPYKANTASVVSAVRAHLGENDCDWGIIVDYRHNTLGWYTVDKYEGSIRLTGFEGRMNSGTFSYKKEEY